MKTLLLLAIVISVWLAVEAVHFKLGPNPQQQVSVLGPRPTQGDAAHSSRGAGQELSKRVFKSSWIVEFVETMTETPEEFAAEYNMRILRLGASARYFIGNKVASQGQDQLTEDSLRADPRVANIRFDPPSNAAPFQVPTTDPQFCNQWHLMSCPSYNQTAVNINVEPAWRAGFTGYAIQIAVIDSGVDYTHPDLASAFVAAESFDFIDIDVDPRNEAVDEMHGTACAGLALAETNTNCGVGVAYGARFSSYRIFGADLSVASDSLIAVALGSYPQTNHIYSNSWGPSGVEYFDVLHQDIAAAFASKSGRGGKGSIFVFSAGNSRAELGQSNRNGNANDIHVIAVAALQQNGSFAEYSSPGANLHISAPGGGFNDVPFMITTAPSNGCINDFLGTSAACPVVSGAVALILEANPQLTSRDVKRILAGTATKNDPNEAVYPWFQNQAGFWVSYNYGFGLINTAKAVDAALQWPGPMSESIEGPSRMSITRYFETEELTWIDGQPESEFLFLGIPDTETEFFVCHQFTYATALTIEYVTLFVDVSHARRGDVAIVVSSPSKTPVILLFPTAPDAFADFAYTFMTPYFADEPSQGVAGTWNSYALQVFGRDSPVTRPTASNIVTSPPYVGIMHDQVNVTITFQDEDGMFLPSVSTENVLIGGKTPSSAQIASSTATSATVTYTIDSAFSAGEVTIIVGDLGVQDKWLHYMFNQTLGTITVYETLPPIDPPVAAGTVSASTRVHYSLLGLALCVMQLLTVL